MPRVRPTSMKPASGSRFGREKFQIVYVNSFGHHRSGNVIHYSGSNSCRHLREQEEVALTSAQASCLTAEAPSAISDGTGSGDAAAPSPSSKDPRGPHLLRATSAKQVEGACERGALSKAGQAKRFKARKLPEGRRARTEELLPSLNQEWNRKRGDLIFPASTGQKSAVWSGVYKVISKMVEENSHFRDRLISCSQFSSEGRNTSENIQTGASCIGTDEAIFGWV
nr:uncharacterized protein C5orf47 homolog isoform X1 [Pogona vitticeps]